MSTLHFPGRTANANPSSVESYTPAWIVEIARDVMGGIDLDPASCERANQTVQAKRYFSREDNGLGKEWAGRVWLNPPYIEGMPRQFAKKLLGSPKVTEYCALLLHNFAARWYRDLMESAVVLAVFAKPVRFHTPIKGESRSYGLLPTGMLYSGPHYRRFIEAVTRPEISTVWMRV